MKTLLQVGDKIRIRDDIELKVQYHMKTDPQSADTYVKLMLKPGSIVTISKIVKCQGFLKYRVEEDPIMNYVDEMFDPDLIEYLYEQIK